MTREIQRLTARPDCFKETLRLRSQQDQQSFPRRLFKGFEQGIRRAGCHLFRMIDQADLARGLKRLEIEFALQAAHLVDLDAGPVRFEKMDVRMVAMIHLAASRTVPAALSLRTVDRPDQCHSDEPFADALRAGEEIRMRQALGVERTMQNFYLALMAENMIKRHELLCPLRVRPPACPLPRFSRCGGD
jgi:hypothetical protein